MRNTILAIAALLCFVQAVICAATNEPSNAASWFGWFAFCILIATLRACLIDIKRGRA